MKLKVYQILNIAGLVAVLVINFLANTLPLGGRTTGEVSAAFPSLFTPAGFTFSIWGLIYLLLILFAVYQSKGLFADSNLKQNRFLYRVDVWFFISCIANVAWLIAWHHQYIILSIVFMAGLLVPLIMVYVNLGAGKRSISRAEYVMVHVPFSVYLGWITVATIANASIFLLKINWERFGYSEVLWTLVMIAVAIAVGMYILLQRKDYFFSLVIVWALFGIFSKHTAQETQLTEPITLTTIIGMAALLTVSMYMIIKMTLNKPAEA